MKVIDKNLLINFESYRKTINEKRDTEKTPSRNSAGVCYKDRVAFSPQVEQIQESVRLIQSIPDVREEKINRIKNEIQQNTYKIDVKKLAEKMLNDALQNEILK